MEDQILYESNPRMFRNRPVQFVLVCALCVEPEARGHGIGYELVRSLLPRAYELSLRELWLSIDGPATIFEHFEFGPVDAESVPPTLRNNPCTTDKNWMRRKLA